MTRAKYVQELRVARDTMTLSSLDEVVEAIRQYAFPEIVEEEGSPGRVNAIRVTVEGEDLWDLRDNLDEVKGEVEGWEHCLVDRFVIDRKYLVSTS